MSASRLRWLLVVVIIELLLIIGLIVWAVTRDETSQQSAKNSNASQSTGTGSLTTALVATGFKNPTNIVTSPPASDDRLFITEQGGLIKTINKQTGKEEATFLDISAKVKSDGGEMGLLGLTFHPNFATNGYFFVNYTDKEDNTIVARYKANAQGKVDIGSEKIVLKVKQPYPNHNGGALAFGPDGFLYIAMGDGGSGGDPDNRSQNKSDLLGKLLRIDVNKGDPYTVPASNPLANETVVKPEIWAWGLRNPWRISFDSQTGDLYIADVGQGKIEELNVQKAASKGGENYGWRCYEGTQAFNTVGCKAASEYITPAFEYAHENGRCSITGGYVYRGQKMASLAGSYVFGDLCTGEILGAMQSGGGWNQTVLLKTPYTISTFGQDQDGELYVADLDSGSIYRLETN